MQSYYAYQIPGSDEDVVVLLRNAARDLLQKFAWEGPLEEEVYTEAANVAGFFIAYYGGKPGTVSRRGMGTWNTPYDEVGYNFQNVIEIRLGEQVACFGWRDGENGEGPIEVDQLQRGPWEFELLKAAGMMSSLPEGSLAPVPFAPEPLSSWTLERALESSDYSRQLGTPLAITVVRHGLRGESVVAERSSFFDLRAVLEGCYATTCEHDRTPYAKGDPMTCFSLEVRIVNTDHVKYRGCPRVQPCFRYFIGSDDGLSLAAALLLAYDHRGERRAFEAREQRLTLPIGGEEPRAPTFH